MGNSKLSRGGLATGTRALDARAGREGKSSGEMQTPRHQPQEERRASSIGLRT